MANGNGLFILRVSLTFLLFSFPPSFDRQVYLRLLDVYSNTSSSDICTFASNTASMALDTSLPASTERIVLEEIVQTSIAGEALKIISTVGGIYVVVNGIFFVIFGRSLLAVLFGMSTYVRPGGEYNRRLMLYSDTS